MLKKSITITQMIQFALLNAQVSMMRPLHGFFSLSRMAHFLQDLRCSELICCQERLCQERDAEFVCIMSIGFLRGIWSDMVPSSHCCCPGNHPVNCIHDFICKIFQVSCDGVLFCRLAFAVVAQLFMYCLHYLHSA